MLPEEKRCSKCGDIKPLDEFHRDRRSPDGHVWACKACTRAVGREYYYRRTPPLEKLPKWVAFTCEVCGREFRYPRGDIEKRKRLGLPMPRFCSQACNTKRLVAENRQRGRV
ncbi:MAG: hypothetical protein PHX88_12515 [Methanoculleus horonobensis]|nr:hypothetical protein [Methanoculleus horonobensis]